MSKLVEIDLNPDAHTLRLFGFIALAAFGFLAAISWYEALAFSVGLGSNRPYVAGGFACLAVLSLLFSAVYPKANLPIYMGLTIVAYPIGLVLSYVIMATLFYLMIAPLGVVMRLMGKDPLEKRIDPEANTYWADGQSARPSESYFKQF